MKTISLVIAGLLLAAHSLSCRTAGKSEGSDTLNSSSKDAFVPDSPGSGGDGKCGRDGTEPMCSNGQICIVAFGGSQGGHCADNPEHAQPKNTSMLRKLKVKPSNGGINPMYQGIQVSAEVMIGSNKCESKGHGAALIITSSNVSQQQVKHVWPVTKVTGATNAACTREFMPVYKSVMVMIPGLLADRDRVVVHGISDAANQELNKLVYGPECLLPACAQPPPGCSMNAPQPSLLDETGCPMFQCGVMECGNTDFGGGGNGSGHMCTAEAGQLYNPTTDRCQGFSNGCQKSAMMSSGFTFVPEGKCQ